jgi:hypothetical protein
VRRRRSATRGGHLQRRPQTFAGPLLIHLVDD